MKKIVLSFICIILLITLVSAFSFDNKISEKVFTFDGQDIKGNELLELYKPIEIRNSFGFGKTLFQGYLSQHTDYCSNDCSSTIEINLLQDGILIDDIKFQTLKDGKWIVQSINSYQLYINGEEYILGEEVKSGIYTILLEGQKKSYRTVDWQITSQGKLLDSWAIWGNISTGAEAQVFLMDPPDDNISINYYNNLSCSALSNTSYITNMSLYTNSTGSWVLNQTADYTTEYTVWIIADSLLESEFNVNDCTIRKINNSIWKLTSTGTYEVQRAKIMQTLFYNGAILNATNVQKLITSDSDDIGMRGHNITYSVGGGGAATATGTFSDTTNNFGSSFWSDLRARIDGALGGTTSMNAEFAIGNQVNIASLSGCDGGTCINDQDETGTDTSADELDNPTNCEFNYGGGGNSGGSGKAGVLILSIGSIGWSDTGGTFSEIDYTVDHSIPIFSGNESYESFNINIENLTLWACQACDSNGDCGMSLENRTISTELIVPEVSISYPIETNDFHVLIDNETLNWTISDYNLDACWYDYNNTNTTITCNDNTTSFILVEDWYNITLWANDTFGNINSSYLEFSYKVLQNSQTYTYHTYETSSETFSINLTANSSLTEVNLIHNTISHSATLSGGLYNVTFDIPNAVGNKSFYWEFTYADTTINSDSYNQTINNTLLGICNATLTVPYINFTFVDEETLLNINATIDTSTWTYYLGSGTITKELIFSNTTPNDDYTFCLSASNDTLYNTRSVQYSSAGYPQRKYDASSALTNATTNKTLYLLSSADGIYSTIQVVDEQGDKVTGVEVTIERQFSGLWTVVGQETTDSAGAVTFWVNPDYDHRLTFISDDCTDDTVTIRPTQTQYTQQLQCGVGAEIYVTPIEGIKYSRTPAEGLILTGEHNFTFEISSSKDNIINVSMYIVNASDGTILASNWSVCSPSGGTIYTLYTVLSGDNIKGRYYVDLGNGSFLLEGDAHWVNVLGPTAFDGKTGFRTFWNDMIFVFRDWGDDSNTADFNRLVAIFFLMCVSISVLNYHFNIDTMNPGAFMFIIFIVVLMGSMVGGTSSQGFFYFNNLASVEKLGEQGATFINNYILAFFCMIISISYWVNVNRQAQR